MFQTARLFLKLKILIPSPFADDSRPGPGASFAELCLDNNNYLPSQLTTIINRQPWASRKRPRNNARITEVVRERHYDTLSSSFTGNRCTTAKLVELTIKDSDVSPRFLILGSWLRHKRRRRLAARRSRTVICCYLFCVFFDSPTAHSNHRKTRHCYSILGSLCM